MPTFRFQDKVAVQIVGHRRRNAYSALRLVIGLVVIGFGCWAAVVAIEQLNERNTALNQQLADIDAKLGAEASDSSWG